jgi:MFS family permease
MFTPSRRAALLVPVLLLPTFMGFLDLWIVLVALPSIRTDLGASTGATQLVVGVYITAYGAVLVLGGRLGDRHGRRRLLTIGLAVFTASSALCAAAPDPTALVVARALQGVGAALMLPQVLTVIQVAVPAERRSAAIGAYTSVIGVAIVSGLVLGGALLQADVLGLGWRALFAINVPIGVAALVLAVLVVPESTVPGTRRLDLVGAGALTVALVVGLLGLVEGADRGWPVWTVAALLASAAGAWAFARHERALERRGGEPLVSPRLLRRGSMRLGLALTLFFYIATSGLFVVLPFLFSEGLGLGPLETGLAFAPLGVAFVVSSLASRRAAAPSGAAPIVVGAVLLAGGLVATIAVATGGGGAVALALPLAVFGLGSGTVFPRIVGVVLTGVDHHEAGGVSGVLLTANQVSNALGVAIVGGVFNAGAGRDPRDAFAVAAIVALAFAVLVGVTAAAAVRAQRTGARVVAG